jgi:adenylosuccinate synthase
VRMEEKKLCVVCKKQVEGKGVVCDICYFKREIQKLNKLQTRMLKLLLYIDERVDNIESNIQR